jgi:hypothetical protein
MSEKKNESVSDERVKRESERACVKSDAMLESDRQTDRQTDRQSMYIGE